MSVKNWEGKYWVWRSNREVQEQSQELRLKPTLDILVGWDWVKMVQGKKIVESKFGSVA